MNIAGIDLAENEERESGVAVLSSEGVEAESLRTNEEIADFLEETNISVVAINSSLRDVNGLTEGEKELEEEGYIFQPASSSRNLVRRAQHLQGLLAQTDMNPEIIRFSPEITRKELALDSDSAFESLGVDMGSVNSDVEFDAVLGAVTARFHQQGQSEDMGVMVPEPMDSESL